ncbi:MAG: hypothetical protein II825_00205 [Paludibacteraceae bacterium]|nr:hypothetical protein [Paludibacteraceae bacterium]
MKAELIIPIDILRGKLRKDGFYFRLYHGQQLVQRCPNRKKHKRSINELTNQYRFGIIAKNVAELRRAGSKLSKKKLWQIASEIV